MSFDSERLSHAYTADDSTADTIAMAVVCDARNAKRPCGGCVHCNKSSRRIHPDITEITRLDNKLIISVDQIRELKKDVYIVPNEAAQKAYIVRDADSMNVNAQNAFLQILEEPPAHAVFILCTNNPLALLPTIRSRCVELRAQRAAASHEDSAAIDELEELVVDYIDALAGDNVKMMQCMFRIDKLDRQAFGGFISLANEHIVLSLRESIVSGMDSGIDSGIQKKREALIMASEIISKAEEMHTLNVSTGHISGLLCASFI